MKKLVSIFALAAIAGAGFAGVDSQNIVGFQNLGGTVNALISVAPTFLNVGSNGPITLGDIMVNDAGLEGGLYVRFFDASGDPLDEGDYVYVNAETDYGADYDGWYLAETLDTYDFPAESCRNSKQIPVGTGFVLIPATAGAELKFVGELKQAQKEVTGDVNALIRVGNASPKDITLADLTVNNAGLEGGLYIRFFDASGDPLDEGDYVYVNAETEYGADYDGWYLAETLDTYDFPAESCRNSKPIPAGTGFVLIPATAGATLIVPNPLPAN